jgi:hypothetical protein
MVFDELRAWVVEQQAPLTSRGLTVKLGASPEDGRGKPSLCLDIDSPSRLGQLILWTSGEAELQLADVASGEVVTQHHDITSRTALDDALESLVSWVTPGPTGDLL